MKSIHEIFSLRNQMNLKQTIYRYNRKAEKRKPLIENPRPLKCSSKNEKARIGSETCLDKK